MPKIARRSARRMKASSPLPLDGPAETPPNGPAPIMPKLSSPSTKAPASPTPMPSTPPARELKELTRLIQKASGFPEVLASLKNGRSATIDGAWGSAGPLAAAGLGLHAPRTLLVVVAHVGDLDDFRDDVATFSGARPEVLPAWEHLPREAIAGDEIFGQRLRVLKRLGGSAPPRFVVAPFQALMQPVPTRDDLERSSRRVQVGDTA